MKYYSCYAETYHNGKLIGTQNGGCCLVEEDIPREQTFVATWENLAELYHDIHLALLFDFNIWHGRKGRRVSFFDSSLFDRNTWDVKEWKEDLNVELKVYHIERNATVEDLKHFDAVKVQKYLNERVDK